MISIYTGLQKIAAVALAIAVIVPGGLKAQSAPSVMTGERVRLWAPEPVDGKVVRATRDTIVVQTAVGDGVVAVSGPSIVRFERWVPGRSRAAPGALLGGLVGVGIAALATANCDPSTDFLASNKSDCFIINAALAVPLSAVAGAVIGHALGVGGWREFRLPDRGPQLVAR